MIIPLLEKLSLNKIYSGVHWSKRKKIADDWHMMIKAHRSQFQAPESYPVGVQYDFYLKGKLLDVSNCMFMVKLLEDGLCAEGILTDDSPKYVKEIAVTVQKGDNEVDICFY